MNILRTSWTWTMSVFSYMRASLISFFSWSSFGTRCLVLWSCPITFFTGLQNEDKLGTKFGDNWPQGKVLIKNGATARILSNEKPTAGNIFGQPLLYFSYYSISELQNCLFPNICSFNVYRMPSIWNELFEKCKQLLFDTTHKTFRVSLNEKWMFLFPLHINIIYIDTNINININITYIKIDIQSNCSVRLSQPHITSWCTQHPQF